MLVLSSVALTGAVGVFRLSPAAAVEASPVMAVAAQNDSISVGADSAGALYWSTDSGSTWVSSGFSLAEHGVTSVIWNGSSFIATSFFGGARSADGKAWTRFMLPVGSAFDPGNLISDSEFFTSGTMTVDEIQAFLDDQVANCRDGYVCMKDYVETTFSRDATVLCNAYEGASNESAAAIVRKVSDACGVSVEALLVLIQKEQSLVTHTWPSDWRFQKATGYACPDTAPCDEKFFGFYNQVYNAAKQFKRYSNPPGTSRFFMWFPVGSTSQVRLHPNAGCGTTPVTIKNQATAGLYYYTPYTPNQSAVVNISAVGDSCSAYGNRNFWRIYNIWFKNPDEYRTMVTASRGVTMAVDREGGVTVSSNLQTWTRPSTIPTASSTNPVLEFGRTADGDFAALTQAGTAFQSEDGGSTWKTLPVPRNDQVQSSVVRHTVAAGDTVWRIANVHGVSSASVVAENSLPGDGSTIYVGQELSITKTSSVSTITSPVIPDPSVIVSSAENSSPPADSSESESESGADGAAADDSSRDSESSAESSPSYPALEPLVTQTTRASTEYVVKRGDTLWTIARSRGVTVSSLVSLNRLANPNRIFVGQRLLVTSGSSVTQSFHRVQGGDTLPVISVRRAVALSELVLLNPGVSSTGDLRDGTLIRVN